MTSSFALNTNNVARGQVTTPAMETQIYPPQWFRNNFRGPQYSDGWQYMGAGGPNLAIRQPGTWPMKFPPGTVMTSATTLQTMAWLNDAYARGMMVNGCDPPVYFGGDPVYVAQGIPCGTPYPMPPQGTYPAPLPVPEPSPVPAPPGGFPLGVPPGGKPPGKRPPLPTPKPGSSFTPMPFAGVPGPKPGSKRPPRPVPPRPSAPAIPPSFSSGPSPRRPNPGVPDMRRTFVPMPAATRSQRPQCPPGMVYSPLEQRCKPAGLTSRTGNSTGRPAAGTSEYDRYWASKVEWLSQDINFAIDGNCSKLMYGAPEYGDALERRIIYGPPLNGSSADYGLVASPLYGGVFPGKAQYEHLKAWASWTKRKMLCKDRAGNSFTNYFARLLQNVVEAAPPKPFAGLPTPKPRPGARTSTTTQGRQTTGTKMPSRGVATPMKRLGTVTRRANGLELPCPPGQISRTVKTEINGKYYNVNQCVPAPIGTRPYEGPLEPITRVPARAVPMKRLGTVTRRANKPGGGPSSCPAGMYKKCIENSFTHGCLTWVCVPYAEIPPITSKPKPVTRVPARAVPMKRLGTVTRRANKTGVNTCPPCYPGSVAKCLQYDHKTLECVKCSCEPTITSRPRPTLISPVPSVRAMKRLGTVTRRANAECKPARGEKAPPGKIWSTEKCTWVNQKISLPDPSDRDPLGGLDPITRVPTRAVPIKRIGVATTRPGPMPLPRDVPRMTAMTRTANQPAASGFSPGTCFDKSTGMVRLPNGRVVKPSSVKVTATMAYVKVGSTSGTVPLCGASSRPAVSTTIASPRRTHRVPVGR